MGKFGLSTGQTQRRGLSRRSFLGMSGAAVFTFSSGLGAAQPHIVRSYLDDWIGDAKDPAAVTARIQAAASSGRTVRIRSGAEYALTRRLTFASNTVFECDAARAAVFHLLSGPGQFDATDFTTSRFSPNRLGLLVDRVQNVRLFGFDVTTDEPRGPSTLIALQLHGTRDCELDTVHGHGFREQNGGYIRIDSDLGSQFRNIGMHDCRMTFLLPSPMQGTCIDIDGDRMKGSDGQPLNSSGVKVIGAACSDISMTAEIIAANSFLQTDGIKVQSEGTSISISDLTVRNTGQALDLWASDSVVTGVRAQDIALSPIKLIYGASRNQIRRVDCDGTGLAVVVIADRPRLPGGSVPMNNLIECNAINVAKYWGRVHAMAQQPAFLIEGNHQAETSRKPAGNSISGKAVGFSDHGHLAMTYVGFNRDAGRNLYDIGGSGYSKDVFGFTGNISPVFRPLPT